MAVSAVWLVGCGSDDLGKRSQLSQLEVPPTATGEAVEPEGTQPELPALGETKDRIVQLFHDCNYINIHAPGEDSMGVNVQGEGREAWQMMTDAVEEAEQGWAIPGQPEIYIWCQTPEAEWRLVELHYAGGVIGSPDSDLGGNVRTLRPTRAFKKGLDLMLSQARARYSHRQQVPTASRPSA
jgi:hypothetical protein